VYKLIEDLNFFHNVFKLLGFFCSFLTFNLLFSLIALLLLGLLCNIQRIRVVQTSKLLPKMRRTAVLLSSGSSSRRRLTVGENGCILQVVA
jgi:ABC-type polysaccharide transport system permease subunit